MKNKFKLLFVALTTSLFLSVGFSQQVQAANQSRTQIKTYLIDYTNQSYPGPTQNYYYDNGAADMTGFTKIKSGQALFLPDSQGRSGTAVAILTYSEFVASKGARQGNPLKPPYYPKNVKTSISFSLTGKTEKGYIWNKSHSIADSLLGKLSYSSKYNFTSGTRSQNVGANDRGGMRFPEEIAENYWKSHPNTNITISYMTTPIYNGNEKIPRGSIVDEKSSDGTINTEIVVINSAEGLSINYNTGSFTHTKNSSSKSNQTEPSTSIVSQVPLSPTVIVYVANKGKSDAYWYNENDMPASTNKTNVVTMTESQAISAGKHASKNE
ncbi:MAG TPA: deoxyribonuclease [Lactovum miscens]|uniref:deoxyribonuclease n=1 Tax=Lactovum miscens TaxID=190387 RepID=UPI002ED7AAF6